MGALLVLNSLGWKGHPCVFYALQSAVRQRGVSPGPKDMGDRDLMGTGLRAAPSTTPGRTHRRSCREWYVETTVPCPPQGGRLPRSRGVAAAAQTCPEDAVRRRSSSLVFTAPFAQYRHGNDAHRSKRFSTSRVGPRGGLADPAPGPSTPSCSGCAKQHGHGPIHTTPVSPKIPPASLLHASHLAQQQVGPGCVSSHQPRGLHPQLGTS